MKTEKTLIWAYVSRDIAALAEKVAAIKGVSVSEYVRTLILEDLDKRSLLTTRLKTDLGR